MLHINDLTKTFHGSSGRPDTQALAGVSFEVKEGNFFTLLGPSGCGKTTTLQCIAGLETPDGGVIRMADTTVFSAGERTIVPANKRRLGMVFQSYAIWPHMTVFDNVAFPLLHGVEKRRPMTNVRKDVAAALEMVELGHLSERPAPMLSGGQQQRVALARALVHRPRILLLDEPLSNLDAKLRDTMRNEIRNLVKKVGITTIFVTHDQVEAVGMSDQIVLMRNGSIVQQGTPQDIYLRPNSVFSADFMGRSSLIEGRVAETGRQVTIETPLGRIVGMPSEDLKQGDAAAAVIRPEATTLVPGVQGGNRVNRVHGRIVTATFLGQVVETEVEAAGVRVVLMLNPYETWTPGSEIIFEIPVERCVIVPSGGARR